MFNNDAIFKAYDIRGIHGQDFDDNFAKDLGLAYTAFRQKEGGQKMKIVVACDMRLSSPTLKEQLIAGLLESGTDVVDIGLTSTPAFYFAVAKHGYDGGIMVSASHNPKQWNGFKLVRERSIPISGETGIQEIKEIIRTQKYQTAKTLGTVSVLDIEEEYRSYCQSYLDLSKIKPMKIAADAANSMGMGYLAWLKEMLPGDLIELNFQLDGSFPAHEADPLKEENLEQLKGLVLSEKANLGIATDGDGDRIFFINEKGETISPAIIRGILAQAFLLEKPASKIGYDVRPGKITEDLILASGGTPLMTRVGHSLIKEEMLKNDIYFAGESSGHFFLNMEIGCFEIPPVMIFKVLEILSSKPGSASEILAPYNRYFHSGEINSDVDDKERIIAKLAEEFQDGQINYLDGISVKYADFWFNVRGSNTENKMRLNLEAISRKIMEEKRDKVLSIINSK